MAIKDSESGIGRERQAEIYLGQASGLKHSIPVHYDTLFRQAQQKMSPEARVYVNGGAGLETTMKANREAFSRWKIVPRMLRDVSRRNQSITLFGRKRPSPFLLCPVGVLGMVHPQADCAVARAAAAEGIPYIFSSQASVDMETTAGEMNDSPRWFQLYWSKSDALTKSFVKRAEACGCEAIVVTLDTTLLGWRAQDLDTAYLPFIRAMGMAQYLSDPVFMEQVNDMKLSDEKRRFSLSSLKTLWQMLSNVKGSPLDHLKTKLPMKAVRHFIATYSRPSLSWGDLDFLKGLTSLPVLLKGIQDPEDATKAVKHGADGIIVSNHGGRQVDGAAGSLDMLPLIADRIEGRIPVLFDSGIRCGADVFKALALGADAVCIGRPYIYALALAGETGVRELLKNFKADLDLTMGLSGCRSPGEINRDCLIRL